MSHKSMGNENVKQKGPKLLPMYYHQKGDVEFNGVIQKISTLY